MNGINKYKSADAYIKAVLMSRTGITKYTIGKYADKQDISIPSSACKEQIIDIIAENCSLRFIALDQQIGVSSITMQRKFHIDNEIVRYLTATGLFHTVGTEPFLDKSGTQRYAALYDVYDYFELTPADITRYLFSLAANRK